MAAITFLLVVVFAAVIASTVERISGWDLGEAGVFIVIALMVWAWACRKFWDDPDKYLEDARRKDLAMMALPAAVTFYAIAYAIATLTFGIDIGDHSWVAYVCFLGATVVFTFFYISKKKVSRTLQNKRGWPSRTEWTNIATNISVGLEASRKRWFIICLRALEEESKKGGKLLNTKIACRSLSGKVDVAIRTYQLWQTVTFLSNQEEYIRFSGNDFANILFHQVGGSETSWKRYDEVDEERRKLRFSIDVTNHMVGYTYTEEALVEEPLLLFDLVEDLTEGTHSVVARAFSDEVRGEKLNLI